MTRTPILLGSKILGPAHPRQIPCPECGVGRGVACKSTGRAHVGRENANRKAYAKWLRENARTP